MIDLTKDGSQLICQFNAANGDLISLYVEVDSEDANYTVSLIAGASTVIATVTFTVTNGNIVIQPAGTVVSDAATAWNDIVALLNAPLAAKYPSGGGTPVTPTPAPVASGILSDLQNILNSGVQILSNANGVPQIVTPT